MVKMTFTFDEDTVGRLRQAAARLAKPQSYVVREAVREYAARVGALSEAERRQMLTVFDVVVPVIPPKPLKDVLAEIAGIRAARGRVRRQSRRA